MDTREHGIHTRVGGIIGDGLVFDRCREELLQGNAIILMLGGSPSLMADLISAGADVIFVHRNPDILRASLEEVEALIYPEVLGSQSRTECRAFDDDISDLVRNASIVVSIGWLHHTPDPRAVLEQWLLSSAMLIVIDTTRKLMIDLITEEMLSPRGEACPVHFGCRDAAQLVGFEIEEDILALWREISTPPTCFQYEMICPWCRNDFCNHRGREYWCAAWKKKSSRATT